MIFATKKRNIQCTLAANPNIYLFQVALWGLKPSANDGKCLVYGR